MTVLKFIRPIGIGIFDGLSIRWNGMKPLWWLRKGAFFFAMKFLLNKIVYGFLFFLLQFTGAIWKTRSVVIAEPARRSRRGRMGNIIRLNRLRRSIAPRCRQNKGTTLILGTWRTMTMSGSEYFFKDFFFSSYYFYSEWILYNMF